MSESARTPGVAEEVPGAADGVAGLEHRPRTARPPPGPAGTRRRSRRCRRRRRGRRRRAAAGPSGRGTRRQAMRRLRAGGAGATGPSDPRATMTRMTPLQALVPLAVFALFLAVVWHRLAVLPRWGASLGAVDGRAGPPGAVRGAARAVRRVGRAVEPRDDAAGRLDRRRVPRDLPLTSSSGWPSAGSSPSSCGWCGGGTTTVPLARRRLHRVVAPVVAVAAVAVTGWGAWQAAHPTVTEYEVSSPRLPAELDGTPASHSSPTSTRGPSAARPSPSGSSTLVNAQEPDLVVIAGDLEDGNRRALRPGARAARRPAGTDGRRRHDGQPRDVPRHRELGPGVPSPRPHGARQRVDDGGPRRRHDDGRRHPRPRGRGRVRPRPPPPRWPAPTPTASPSSSPTSRWPPSRSGGRGSTSSCPGTPTAGSSGPGRYLVPLQQPMVDGVATVGDTTVVTSRGAGAWGPPVRVGADPEGPGRHAEAVVSEGLVVGEDGPGPSDVGRHRPAAARLLRHRVGHAGPRRARGLRAALPRGLPVRAVLGDDPAQAPGLPRGLRRLRPRRRRRLRRRRRRAAARPTPASCATGPRSTPRSRTPARPSRCARTPRATSRRSSGPSGRPRPRVRAPSPTCRRPPRSRSPLSQALKRKGFTFVGPTTMYALHGGAGHRRHPSRRQPPPRDERGSGPG